MSSLNDSVNKSVMVYRFLLERERFINPIKSIEKVLGWFSALFVGVVAWVIGVFVIQVTAPMDSIAATQVGSILVGLPVGLLGALGGYYFGVKVLYPWWWRNQVASFGARLNFTSSDIMLAKSISTLLDEAQAKESYSFKLLVAEQNLDESLRFIVDKVNSVLSGLIALPLSDDQKAGVRNITGELNELSEMWFKVSFVFDSEFEALMVQGFQVLLSELTALQEEFLNQVKNGMEEKLERLNVTYARVTNFLNKLI